MSRKNRGAIVNLSSVAALTGLEVVPHYSAAKGAILAFTRAVAQRRRLARDPGERDLPGLHRHADDRTDVAADPHGGDRPHAAPAHGRAARGGGHGALPRYPTTARSSPGSGSRRTAASSSAEMPTATELSIRGTPVQMLQDGSGPPLMFLHGAGGAGRWLAFQERLAKDFSVYFPSHPATAARRPRSGSSTSRISPSTISTCSTGSGSSARTWSARRSAAGSPRRSRRWRRTGWRRSC